MLIGMRANVRFGCKDKVRHSATRTGLILNLNCQEVTAIRTEPTAKLDPESGPTQLSLQVCIVQMQMLSVARRLRRFAVRPAETRYGHQ